MAFQNKKSFETRASKCEHYSGSSVIYFSHKSRQNCGNSSHFEPKGETNHTELSMICVKNDQSRYVVNYKKKRRF